MLPDINLLPKYEKERSLLYIIFIIGLILAFLLTGFVVYQYITVSNELKEVNTRNTELAEAKEILELQMTKQEPDEKEGMKEAVAYAERYVVPTSKLIDQLMTFLPATGYLSQYEYQEGKVAIDAHFETMTDASTYVAKLDASEFIKNAKVNSLETFELDASETSTEDEADDESAAEVISPFELLPRYQVTYSFEINSFQLKKETKENE